MPALNKSFHILNEPSTPVHESEYPYQLITEKLFGNDPVTITGDLKAGQNITASCGLPPAPPTPYKNAVTYYTWYRSDNLICTNTTGVYTLSEKDIGKTLRVDVTYDDFRGEISKSITNVTIGRNVRTIGKQTFYKCKNLKTIVIKSDSLDSIGSKPIKNINKKAKITCPKKKKAAYKKLFTKKAGYTQPYMTLSRTGHTLDNCIISCNLLMDCFCYIS